MSKLYAKSRTIAVASALYDITAEHIEGTIGEILYQLYDRAYRDGQQDEARESFERNSKTEGYRG